MRLEIVEGAKVRLKDVREIATVRRILKNGNLEVDAGFMKMQIPREDVVEVVSKDTAQTKLPKNVKLEAGPTWDVTLSRDQCNRTTGGRGIGTGG